TYENAAVSQKQPNQERHDERGGDRRQRHGNAGEETGGPIDLESARGTDSVGSQADRKAARRIIADAHEIHEWRDDERADNARENDQYRRERRVAAERF